MRSVLIAALATALIGLVPSPAIAGDRPIVEVVDAGAEPRTALRLDVQEGDEFFAVFELSQQIEQEIDGERSPLEPVPVVREEVALRVEEVSASGRARYGFELENVEIIDATGVDPQLVDELEDELGSLSGITGNATVTARGVVLESEIDIPDDLSATVRDLVEQLRQQLPSLTAPLPRQPVGAGARWRASTDVSFAGIDSENANEYQLLELDGSRLVLGVSVRQRAEPQDVDSPSTPEGADVRLESSRFEGSGTVELDLMTLVPRGSSATIEGRQRFTIDDDGDRQTLRQSVTLRVAISPSGVAVLDSP